jgi:hypothetical protein
METWVKRLFLIFVLGGASIFSFCTLAQEDDSSLSKDSLPQDSSPQVNDVLDQIITPDIKRRAIKEDDLDSEDFEVGGFYGLLSVEDFGINPVQGVNIDYHITEGIFVEFVYAISKTEKTSFETLSGGVELLTEDQRDLSITVCHWDTIFCLDKFS